MVISSTRSLLLAILLCSSPHAATATPTTPAMACHALMTPKECSQFKTQLQQLQAGTERDLFLRDHADTMKARETACDCNRKLISEIIYLKPGSGLLHF